MQGHIGGVLRGLRRRVFRGEIDRVSSRAQEEGADAVVGVGGGKAMDTAKAVANPVGLPLVIVPTIASTDAPTSSLAVIYTEEGEFQEYRFFGRNPDARSSWTRS